MRCAYREVMAQEKCSNAYRDITDHFLEFLDASAGCVMHRLHGHGQNRLFDMFGGLVDAVNDAMTETTLTEDKIGEDAPENVRAILSRIQNQPKSETQLAEEAVEEYKDTLARCGFDMDAVAESVPKVDRFTRWVMDDCVASHAVREDFLNNVWIIVQMYHGALLADYYDYCGWYLRSTESGDIAALRMAKDRVKDCKRIGITLER